jgi:polysaccharide biosynthesis protein PelG
VAGIGFELKKLFSNKGIILSIRANLYASMVIAGPMILGALLLLGSKIVASFGGASNHEQDLIVVIITYSLLFSLLLSSLLLFILARYIADMLYINAYHRILPSMYGSISLLLLIGASIWAVFLYFCQIKLEYSIYSFILFCEGLVVWIQINYITATKDYRGILVGFVVGISAGLSAGFFLVVYKYDVVASMLLGACISYGILITVFTQLLHKYFPIGSGNPLKFLEWIDEYPQLLFVGFFSTLALFTHIILMWLSPWGIQVEGLFYHAPAHDIPVLLAFVTSLVTTVNFVTSVEVNFYPKYRLYFSLLNGDGSLSNIEKAHEDMVAVLRQELFYLAIQQIFVTVFAIVVVGEILVYFPLGFTSIMIGVFRVLCIGYGAYAIGNSLMLFLLYFASNADALSAVLSFFAVNVVGTLYTITLSEPYYGFGFVAASIVYYLIAEARLFSYTEHLDYFIFTKQPVFFVKKKGFFTRIVSRFEV